MWRNPTFGMTPIHHPNAISFAVISVLDPESAELRLCTVHDLNHL
jgi:hypothetical protein